MTTPHQADDPRRGPAAEPDQPLNAEPITPLPAAIARPRSSQKTKGKYRELSWAFFGGLLPFIVALIAHGAIVGWSTSTVDPSNLGYSLFALSLAGIVRIVSHGSGKDVLPLLLIFGIIQMVLALYYAGTFNASPPSQSAIKSASHTSATKFSQAQIDNMSSILSRIGDDEHSPTETAWICLIATGILSTAVMVRFWSPAISEARES